jgi:hypothetical protein
MWLPEARYNISFADSYKTNLLKVRKNSFTAQVTPFGIPENGIRRDREAATLFRIPH